MYKYKPTSKLEECGYRLENMWRCCTLPLCLRASHEVSSTLGIIISTRSISLGNQILTKKIYISLWNTYNWILKNKKKTYILIHRTYIVIVLSIIGMFWPQKKKSIIWMQYIIESIRSHCLVVWIWHFSFPLAMYYNLRALLIRPIIIWAFM